jgi:hypothetical protein
MTETALFVIFLLFPIILSTNHMITLSVCSCMSFYITIHTSLYFFTHPDRIETLIWLLISVSLFALSSIKWITVYATTEEKCELVKIQVD